jgi:hypothetical protein
MTVLITKSPDSDDYIVRAGDDDNMELSIFSGPHALERAKVFLSIGYYEGFQDPESLLA